MLFEVCVSPETRQALFISKHTIASWLTMTQQPTEVCPANAPAEQTKSGNKKQISVDEIAAAFQTVGQDIMEIGKLASEETLVVEQFLASLQKYMPPVSSSIAVSPSVIPIDIGVVAQAYIQPNGHLKVTFTDKNRRVLDLREPKYRSLMVAVMNDVLPKFEALAQEMIEENRHRATMPATPHVEMPPPPPPAPVPEPISAVTAEPPISLAEPAPIEELPKQEPQIEVPAPDLSAERDAKIEAITAETLGYLEMLGGEVFEQEPVSKYFDDWMVNLRQIILSFESSDVIGQDEAFGGECNQIFGNIEEELSKRIANEADIAVSARTLVENRYLLNKIDEGYAAQTKDLVDRGTSAIENLMRNMQSIEKELSEVEQIKTSYRHPLQKMAKDQKIAELTQKLNAVKKRLAMAVGTSSVDSGKAGDIDTEFAAHSKMLEEKRKIAMDFLNQNVHDLQHEIDEIKKSKTNNPIKRVANQQQIFELTEKLIDAKKRLSLAEQNSSAEMESLRAEYEKKKQAALGKVQSLENDIATKAVDNSAGVRKEAAKALAEAAKSLAERKKAAPMLPATSEAPEG
jgi:hypothetical protein